MSRPLLEVIALTPADAIAAQAGGADRLELVTDMAADGLTPSRETFAAVRSAVDLPVRVMLRASDGFATGNAFDALCEAAAALHSEGADEFVLGFLADDGGVDLAAVTALTEVVGAGGGVDESRWTFHRAIDRAADRDGLRKRLADIPGLDTYLTAGSARGVDDGLPTLLAEAERAGTPGYEARIMVGGGLRLDHLPALRAAGINAFHIGGAARPDGWSGPVDATAVGQWRTILDAPVPVA
ncbi:copper homeostasis protein CutC [Streptomyces sp. DSM 41524]|uniref:Copper homeostasis protein cutC homolog n=1 Tax=Streptomyces asiaticus subsp. ignotus TaxID=3098222 RepID=A0ABU7PTW7_9ACTN|nr:copper homeostasis protein CutC [Streptomyces sp. DASNCL29]MEE4591871.1 copper homeostasis protein CutC [Streptomyces sp. DSM 41524]TMU93987.1 copper homeostasis protein CutC [Streptomyces sp. DASNCL29]